MVIGPRTPAPGPLVPGHLPGPFRFPLRDWGLGAYAPAQSQIASGSEKSLRFARELVIGDGWWAVFNSWWCRAGLGPLEPTPAHWSPYTPPDLCGIPSGTWAWVLAHPRNLVSRSPVVWLSAYAGGLYPPSSKLWAIGSGGRKPTSCPSVALRRLQAGPHRFSI